MNTLTKDFTGIYDYPAEEALLEAMSFNEHKIGYTYTELQSQLERLRCHWIVVFGNDKQGQKDFERFVEVFNQNVESKYSLS